MAMTNRGTVFLGLVVLLSTGARASYLSEPRITDSFLGWSSKYKQFAVRREVRFSLSGQGRDLPGVKVEQPTEDTAKLPVAPGFTCAAFCSGRGLKCSDALDPGGYRKHSVSPMPAGYTYDTLDCSEPLVDRYVALAKAGKTMGRKPDSVAQVMCHCQQSRQAQTFTNFPSIVSLTLVEVYDASGALKRIFLEDVSQAETLAKLKSDLDPIPESARVLLDREIVVTAGLLSAHLKDGAFTIAKATGKHPRGKCVVTLDPGKLEERGDDLVRTVSLGVTTPSSKISLFNSDLYSDTVTFDAWWLPAKPSVLVGILKATENVDPHTGRFDLSRVFVVPPVQLSSCD